MPAAVEKIVQLIGLLAKAEGTYGAGGALAAATDGVQLVELPDMPVNYLWDGDVGSAPGTGGLQPANAPVGAFTEFPYKTRIKGSGAAYSASVLPKDIHVGMQMSGHDVAVVTTGGAETVTYSPRPGPVGFTSGVLEGYGRGQKYNLIGAVADMIAEGNDEGPVIATFPLKALVSPLPTDVAVPSITYPHTVIAPNGNNIALSLGTYLVARVRKWRWALNRKVLGPRTDRNAAGGHAGYGLSPDRAPELTVTIEATAFVGSPFHTVAGLQPFQLRDLATKLAWTIGPIGGTQYNKFKLSGPQGQIMKVTESVDGDGVSLWELLIRPSATTLVANDDYSWLFN